MPILTSGSTTTVTLGAYDSITLQNRSGQAASISVGGTVVNGNHSGSRTYGPYPSGGSVSLNAISGDLYYEVADGAGDTKRVFARGSALLAEDGSTVSAGRPTLRNVARQCYIANEAWNMDNFTSRSRHTIYAPVTFVRLVWVNARVSGSLEVVDSDITNFEAAIEYPVGTFTRVTFRGSNSVTFAGGTVLESDDVPLFAPAGANIYVRTYGVCASGKLSTVFGSTYPLDNDSMRVEYGTTAAPVTNKVLGGTVTNTNQYIQFRPAAIVSLSSMAAYWLEGDSRSHGTNDNETASQIGRGEVEKGVYAAGVPYCKSALSGQRLQLALTSYKLRGYIASRYHTHIINQLGINDLNVGGGGSNLAADGLMSLLSTLRATFPDHWMAQVTLSPYTTGTYTTEDGQTPVATVGARRETFNDALYAGAHPLDAIIDGAAAVETRNSRGERVWRAGITSDGLHPASTGFAEYLTRGVYSGIQKK